MIFKKHQYSIYLTVLILTICISPLCEKVIADEKPVLLPKGFGQAPSMQAVSDKGRAVEYSQVTVEEIKLADMVNQIKRGFFYAQKSGLNYNDQQKKVKNLQSISKEANKMLSLSGLGKDPDPISPGFSPPFNLPNNPPKLAPPPSPDFSLQQKNNLQPTLPLGAPNDFQPLQPILSKKRSSDFNKKDFKTLQEKIDKGNSLAKEITQKLQRDAKTKFPWFTPINKTLSSATSKGKEQLLNHITFGLRIEDMGMNIYNRSWNWDILKPFGFDLISPHPQLYFQGINPEPNKYSFKSIDNLIQENREHGFNTSIEINSYHPSWIMRKYGEPLGLFDPVHSELFWHNSKGGTVNHISAHTTFNIWHPEGRKTFMKFVKALGRRYGSDKRVSIYELFNEYQMETKDEEPAGYSQVARREFHKYLSKKHKSINKLNQLWRTSFQGFNEIEPPTSLLPSGDEQLTPRLYDFEKFRQDSTVNFFDETIKALKETDAKPLISSQLLGFFNGPAIGPIEFPGLDLLRLADLDWDILGKHDDVQNTTDARLPNIDALYTYSLNRYTKHLLWNDEFWWTAWEGANTTNKQIVRNVIERNIWRQIAWGKRGLIFYTLDHNFAGIWNDNLLRLPGKRIMRYPSGVIPLLKKKLQEIEAILFESEISSHHIGILQPSTSLIVASPVWTSTKNAIRVAEWLLTNHYIPFFIPEEVILNGKEDLKDIKFLIVPYATHVPDKLTDNLLKWVKDGGTLLSLGPLGVYNEYGHRTNHFLTTIFELKDQDLKYVAKGWKVGGGAVSAGFLSKKRKFKDGYWELKSTKDKVLKRNYGKGKVIFWVGTELTSKDLKKIEKVTNSILIPLKQIKEKIIKRRDIHTIPFLSKDAAYNLELVLLNTPKGEKYLFIINLDVGKEIEAEISIKGRYKRITDLTFDGGIPVPSAYTSGWTQFSVLLSHGQGLFFKLM